MLTIEGICNFFYINQITLLYIIQNMLYTIKTGLCVYNLLEIYKNTNLMEYIYELKFVEIFDMIVKIYYTIIILKTKIIQDTLFGIFYLILSLSI